MDRASLPNHGLSTKWISPTRTWALAWSIVTFIPDLPTQNQIFRAPLRWLFVRVETGDNFVGWGESTLEHTETVGGAFADLASKFMGWDADGIEDTWQATYKTRF
ncbi:hypothetical protein PAXRUDRAFT_9212 [Paxillus rubicundulus Ve08.2h10]|uniref:Mandelate racemase/muconate lactonizing enzyme N-terminal domain-containing protein n=1 Tax=Paxillus rubicundulus Ve08.2h10 TaxID=930991 RepID=A0A0D0EC80_9AGAM|nr:hypothetical protein PAXRUDRAFT_9212 [Paxillus rubicundulus Ve08.2h10]